MGATWPWRAPMAASISTTWSWSRRSPSTDTTSGSPLLRFVDDDRMLVSADVSGQVVLRRRTADGYTTAIAEVALPRDEIEVAESIAEPFRPA